MSGPGVSEGPAFLSFRDNLGVHLLPQGKLNTQLRRNKTRLGRYNILPTHMSRMCWRGLSLSVTPGPQSECWVTLLLRTPFWVPVLAMLGGAHSSCLAVALPAFPPPLALISAASRSSMTSSPPTSPSCIEKWLMNCLGNLLVGGVFPHKGKLSDHCAWWR